MAMSDEKWDNMVAMGSSEPEGDLKGMFRSVGLYPLARLAMLSAPADEAEIRDKIRGLAQTIEDGGASAEELCTKTVTAGHAAIDRIETAIDQLMRDQEEASEKEIAEYRRNGVGGGADAKEV